MNRPPRRHTFPLVLAALTVVALLPAAAAGGPGNSKIAFDSGARLYAVDPDTGGETDLGSGFAPAWSPHGTQIAFSDGGVSVMNADGSGRRLLHAGMDRWPVWSPDGTRLAFVTTQTNDGALLVVNVATGDLRVVAATAVRLSWPPAWSPDGTQLAYTEGTATDLAVVGADGNGHRIVSGGTGVELGPAWSPDGAQIAFIHAAPGDMPALHSVDANGGPVRRLAQTGSGFPYEAAISPAWSPDGSRIAFTGVTITGYDRFGPIYSRDVYVVDAEGTLERRLTNAQGTAPVWSPDGRRIAFQAGSNLGGPYVETAIYMMNPNGTCETRVGERAGRSLTWRPVPLTPPAPLLRCADLDLNVVNEHGAVAIGGEESFQIFVKNLENEPATGVRLQASSPDGGAFLSASPERGACLLAEDGALSCELGTLPVGGSVRVTVVARAAGAGLFSSRARATANEPDGSQSNNDRELRFEALPCTIVSAQYGGRLVGTRGPDTICGQSGPDVIQGLAGADSIDAGRGSDRVFPGAGRDQVALRAGADFVDARDGERDVIDCGGERDLVLADPIDLIARDCELVARPQIRCKTLGTGRSDELVGSPRTDSVCALSGNDEIHTLGGADAVDAGGGSDTLVGGPGHDLLLAGEGYDTILARDGERDRVRCGPQRDLVLADRFDVVARDCEEIQRR